MKKYFTIKILGTLLIAMAITSCQKDQTETEMTQSSNSNDEMSIRGNAVAAADISGLISQESAERMRENFDRSYKSHNKTEYVAFSVKDISNYMHQLKSKYKSDSVYVSFGVYDEKTAVNKKDAGRITIFFMGKNKVSLKGNIKSQDEVIDDGTGSGSNYFNHGTIWP